ncbi:MAG: Cof-type HAD-IIB family hydrolase [Floccifex sp.]
MKKIVFLDLDGTFWDFEKIPQSALKAMEIAKKNGHKFFVNTGRTKCEINQVLWDLDFDGYCFSSGSEIILNNEQIFYHPLGISLAKDIHKIVESMGLGYSMEGSQQTFINEINRDRMLKFAKENRIGNHFTSFPNASTMKDTDYEQIMKVSVHLDEPNQKDKLLKALPENVVFTQFQKQGGEITLKQYNKATAIQFLENYFHHEYESMACGDSDNDIPMLKYAHISVAMGNGSQSVKEICDFVTSDINENGLYNAFDHYLLLK